jgi:hypothetical protein
MSKEAAVEWMAEFTVTMRHFFEVCVIEKHTPIELLARTIANGSHLIELAKYLAMQKSV